MFFKVLICIASLVVYIKAKSSYNYHDIASQIIDDIKKDYQLNKVSEGLHNLTEKLKYVNNSYLPQSQKDLQENYVNAFELLQKYPKTCTKLKTEKFKIVTTNGIASFKNCDGFKYASERVKILLDETEHALSEIEETLVDIAKDIFNCTMHSPFVAIQCMVNLKQLLSEHINYVVHVTGTFINDAEENIEEIIADVLSCFAVVSTEINTNMTKLFDEVRKCASNE